MITYALSPQQSAGNQNVSRPKGLDSTSPKKNLPFFFQSSLFFLFSPLLSNPGDHRYTYGDELYAAMHLLDILSIHIRINGDGLPDHAQTKF